MLTSGVLIIKSPIFVSAWKNTIEIIKREKYISFKAKSNREGRKGFKWKNDDHNNNNESLKLFFFQHFYA